MDNIKIETIHKKGIGYFWLINERYTINQNNGSIQDKEKTKDIPQWIFNIRDELIYKNK